MLLNGRKVELDRSTSLPEILEQAGLEKSRVAVLHNGRIVPRVQLDRTEIADSDVLEVVSFVGGG
ncbi:MAG: sulfur carrier protein ThiS [Deltaproteobacteria bacterium]|jgi:sulfur carrier protein|nr:sulfur carrier protein ThiS [Deltaproteobacteria bacterium]